MKLLHTSDWHLGRTLHGVSLLDHQRQFLDWLVKLAVAEQVDAVLVAGDVYDRAMPPTDAVTLLDDALAAFVGAGIPIMLTSGNHDSAIRLGFGRRLTAAAGVHLRTRIEELTEPLLLRDDAGEVAVYGIPYLLPDAVMDDLGAERSHASVLTAAVEQILADAASRGISRVVASAHAFVTGGVASESERDIRVGGIGDAPASVFAGLAYAALGHLHGSQELAQGVAYSGSPLAFSFSEKAHTKSVRLVEIDAAGAAVTTLVPAPVARPLREVRGRLADLLALEDESLAGAWVKAVLTDASRPMDPMGRLRERWPHTIVLDFAPESELVEAATDLRRMAETTDPVEICANFVEWVDSTLPHDTHLRTLNSVVEAIRRAESA